MGSYLLRFTYPLDPATDSLSDMQRFCLPLRLAFMHGGRIRRAYSEIADCRNTKERRMNDAHSGTAKRRCRYLRK